MWLFFVREFSFYLFIFLIMGIYFELLFYREQSKKKIGRQMELAGSNLTEDQLEDMLDKGEGAQLVGHVHIEGKLGLAT